MSSRRAPGFSLVELVTVMVVVGLLTSVAAPAFTSYLQRLRVRAALDGLTADVYYARILAVRLHTRVHVRFQPPRGCARSYALVRADSGRVLRTVSLGDAARGVCLTSGVPRALSIDSRGLLIGSARTLHARSGRQVDSITISIVGRVYRGY